MTASHRPVEATEIHTRLLRLALAIEESRAYWAHLDPTVPPGPRALLAFEQRWFGLKSLERVRTLLANFSGRYDAYAAALSVLRRWPRMDPQTRQSICHWHLQLADPIYRGFTGSFLLDRRHGPKPTLDRDLVMRWVEEQCPTRWSTSTCAQFASKLLSAATEAGLLTPPPDPRTPRFPRVTDQALTYLLYLLREVDIAGTLLDNPYLASVGLSGDVLDQRLRNLPGLTYHRMGHLSDLGWDAPCLSAWAEANL